MVDLDRYMINVHVWMTYLPDKTMIIYTIIEESNDVSTYNQFLSADSH